MRAFPALLFDCPVDVACMYEAALATVLAKIWL